MIAPPIRTVTAATVLEKTDSGARVVKVLADDSEIYWTKFSHSDHGPEAVAFEVIATIIGNALDAPIPEAAFVQIPDGLETVTDARGVPIGKSLGFGSLSVEGHETDKPEHVEDDGNPGGLPRLLALTELCMGDDEQFLVEPNADNRLYGFDFDSWFAGNHPGWDVSWFSDDIEDTYIGRSWRELKMREDFLLDARSAVEGLPPEIFQDAVDAVPRSWNVQESQLLSLARLLHDRKHRVIRTLDEMLRTARR